MNSVLLIDDDKELCTLMKKCVEQENLSAVVAHGGLEGLRLLEENKGYLFFDYSGCDDAGAGRAGGMYADPGVLQCAHHHAHRQERGRGQADGL